MKAINKSNLHFILEQDGEVERKFKKALRACLIECGKKIRAYLVQVKYYDNDPSFNVALCFRIEKDIDYELFAQATEVFKSMFGVNEHLDVIFLDQTQEIQIRKICCPFFTSKNYQFTIPDFFLTSSESYNLRLPRACFKREKLYGKHHDSYMLCDISPPLVGQLYGRGEENIEQVILAIRHKDYTLFPVKDWPAYVLIALLLKKNMDNDYIEVSDMELIAWGELYNDKEAALKAINNL